MVHITGQSLSDWADDVNRLASRTVADFENVYGYPPDENEVTKASSPDVSSLADSGVSGDLLTLYSGIQEVSLPDVVENGISVFPLEDVVAGISSEMPTEVHGALEGKIVVFGADGGGGYIAQLSESGNIYKLTFGTLIGQRYEVSEKGFSLIAEDVWGFLEFIRDEVSRMVS